MKPTTHGKTVHDEHASAFSNEYWLAALDEPKRRHADDQKLGKNSNFMAGSSK